MLQDPNVPPSASAPSAGRERPVTEPAETGAEARPGASAAARPTLWGALHRLVGGRDPEAAGARGRAKPPHPRALDPLLAALLAERKLVLGGIPEGVIAVNVRGEVTRLNETARLLLDLPETVVGRSLAALGLDADAIRALGARGADDRDRACVAAGRLLVLNQVTVQPRRGSLETVTTLRDRTELVTLRIPGTVQLPSPSDQTDEFTHRAHTVETLARLGTASFGYLNAICAETRGPLTRIMDPFVSALLIRRTAVATGRGAALRLTTDSELPRLDPATSADVVTVLGILLENALDSVEGSEVRELTVHVDTVVAGVATPLGARVVDVRVRVHDTGPGIAGGLIDHVFEIEQITQAPVRHRADPGFGLAVVQLIATRRGGSVGYEFIDGAAFDAVLPVRPAPAVPAAAPTAD